jgi:hypothetical protein
MIFRLGVQLPFSIDFLPETVIFPELSGHFRWSFRRMQ